MSIIIIVSLGVLASDTIACRNGPNYWGNAFPGQGQAQHYYRNPRFPAEYFFGGPILPNSQSYDGSHYGSHDWVADAALRSLINPIMNPLNFKDWDWLIDASTATNKNPTFSQIYGDTNNKHNTVNSYITFLFATQMPDMRIKKEKPEETWQYYPQKIEIPSEGLIIQDLMIKKGKWVGQIQQHSYNFNPIKRTNGFYDFIPYYTMPATKALQLSKEAIKCISNRREDDDGNLVSAMQPEGSAGWLGSMSHYIVDLVIPAHTIIDNEVYNSKYHKWFENQLASCTKWNKVTPINFGPELGYFSYDISLIDKLGQIFPLPPNIAVDRMATKTIKAAFREDGTHQHITFNGDNLNEAYNSGLFLDNDKIDEMMEWNWKNDIDTNGRDNSIHRFFYEKVEELLCWATYYTACAMQHCYNEGKEKNDDKDPDVNFFVENPERFTPPSTRPEPEPQKRVDDYIDVRPEVNEGDRVTRDFKNFSKLLATISLMGIREVIEETIALI
jgi:hypothetical protein